MKNKSLLPALVLVAVHALLLIQDISITNVLCHKNDGSVKLELAFSDFSCFCQNDHKQENENHIHSNNCSDNHQHSHHTNTEQRNSYNSHESSNNSCGICSSPLSCFDAPLSNAQFQRQLTSKYKIKLQLTTIENPTAINLSYSNAIFASFCGMTPPSKFLNGGLSSVDLSTTVILC